MRRDKIAIALKIRGSVLKQAGEIPTFKLHHPCSNQAGTHSHNAKSQVRRLPLSPQSLHRGEEAQYLPSASSWLCYSARHGVPVTAGSLQQTGSSIRRGEAFFPCQIGYTKMALFVRVTCPILALLLSLSHAA